MKGTGILARLGYRLAPEGTIYANYGRSDAKRGRSGRAVEQAMGAGW